MRDSQDPASPSPAAPSRRPRRFDLPDDLHTDGRLDEAGAHGSAFLDGLFGPAPQRLGWGERTGPPITLERRQDWIAAVRHEAARHARYGRPTSILLLELSGCGDQPAVDRTAKVLADVITANGRGTDRATRFEAVGFRMLLPETGGRAAQTVAERLERAFAATIAGGTEGVALSIERATAEPTDTVEAALIAAEGRLADRLRPS